MRVRPSHRRASGSRPPGRLGRVRRSADFWLIPVADRAAGRATRTGTPLADTRVDYILYDADKSVVKLR